MANVVKKDSGQGQQATQGQGAQGQQGQRGELVRRDPFGMTRDPFQMLSRDPFQLMREMLVDPFRAIGGMGRDLAWNPGFEIRETDDAIVFKADMPGMRNEDLDISLNGNQLVISGNREQEQEQGEGQFHTYERTYGSFTRSFALPDYVDLDQIHSDLKDGVLTLIAPKKAGSTPQRRKIQVGKGSKS
jgi:HSP20 family protein